jgi:glycerol-3-phosphate acyltransferase PlsY
VLCFFLDFLKGLLPTLAALWLLSDAPAAAVCAGAAAVVGHMWPIFLGFKGGKGVSTTAGALAALAPLSLLISGALWVVVFKLSRYVSLASVLAALALPLSAFALDASGIYPLHAATIAVLTALSAVSILKHAGNIRRLVNGTENRFEKKKKGESNENGGA